MLIGAGAPVSLGFAGQMLKESVCALFRLRLITAMQAFGVAVLTLVCLFLLYVSAWRD